MGNTFDGLSLQNSRDSTCNNTSLVYKNDIKNILEIFALKNEITGITGLPPETLNTLQKLSAAINNGSNLFSNVIKSIRSVRNMANSYDKSYFNALMSSILY